MLSRLLVLLLLVGHSTSALALRLGEISVNSSLGQPLRARVPVSLAAGEDIAADCVSASNVDPFNVDPVGILVGARVTLQRDGARAHLLVTSPQAVTEPAIRLVLKVNCGTQGALYREYTLLLDPPLAREPTVAAAPMPPAPPQLETQPTKYSAQVFDRINEYTVQEGDTLSSIAERRYPGNGVQQRRLRRAIAAANSDVLLDEFSALPQAGTPLLIPDLVEPRAQPQRQLRKPRLTQVRRPARAPSPVALAPEALPQAGLPAADNAKAPAPPPPPPPPPPAVKRETRTRAGEERGQFVLRLSRSALDIDTDRPISDAERAALRDRQALLNADDLTANMLALQHEMRQMKAEIAELKAQLKQQAGAAPSAPVIAPEPAQKPVTATNTEVAATAAAGAEGGWLGAMAEQLRGWWWLVPAIALAALIAALLHRRRRALEPAYSEPPTLQQSTQQATLDQPTQSLDLHTHAPPLKPSAPAVMAAAPRLASEKELEAHYLAERFPDLAESGFDLSNADSVVEQSRVYFMEDGSADKAIELLEYTLGKFPNEQKLWLALLEIYRQMKMKGAFERLARNLRERFADSALWSKVASIGYALDPNNELYQPAEHQAPNEQPSGVLDLALDADLDQPKAANWLDVPLDFTPTLRAEEMRNALLLDLPDERAEPAGKVSNAAVDFDLDLPSPEPATPRVEPKFMPKTK